MFNVKYLILFNIFFAFTNGLNPRKLLLQRRTEDYDKEYYDYYGSSSDSYENVKLKFTKHGRYKLIESDKLNTVKYCWNCNATTIEECRQEGFLQTVSWAEFFIFKDSHRCSFKCEITPPRIVAL